MPYFNDSDFKACILTSQCHAHSRALWRRKNVHLTPRCHRHCGFLHCGVYTPRGVRIHSVPKITSRRNRNHIRNFLICLSDKKKIWVENLVTYFLTFRNAPKATQFPSRYFSWVFTMSGWELGMVWKGIHQLAGWRSPPPTKLKSIRVDTSPFRLYRTVASL